MQSFPLYTLLWSFLWTSEHHLCTYSLSEQVTLGLRYNLDLGDICECPAFCPTWYWSAISLSVDRISLSWHLHLHRFFLTYASNRWFWNFHTADVNFWGVAMTHFWCIFSRGTRVRERDSVTGSKMLLGSFGKTILLPLRCPVRHHESGPQGWSWPAACQRDDWRAYCPGTAVLEGHYQYHSDKGFATLNHCVVPPFLSTLMHLATVARTFFPILDFGVRHSACTQPSWNTRQTRVSANPSHQHCICTSWGFCFVLFCFYPWGSSFKQCHSCYLPPWLQIC